MADEIKMVYNKICQNPSCNKEYKSTSRNQKYCCEECADKMKAKKKAQAKRRKVRRKEREEAVEISRALTRAYGIAHIMAEEVYKIPKVCDISGQTEEQCGLLELHHKDSNPFNNSPDNLVWLSKSMHKRLHDKTKPVNQMEVWKQAQQTEDPISYWKEAMKDIEKYEDIKAIILAIDEMKGATNE